MIKRGNIRGSIGYAIFRMIFGMLFVALGIYQLASAPHHPVPGLFSVALGSLFVGFGAVTFLFPRVSGSKLEIEAASATERLAEITRLQQSGLISQQEFEAKRQEILKEL